jgi:MFS family permease
VEPAPPLFRQPNFAALWGGQLISIVGERLTYLALLGLIAEHTKTFDDPARSSLLLALLLNVMLAPVLILAPFTGAWVDRWNLKRVMVISDLLRGAIVLLMPVFYSLTDHTGPVFVLVFLLFTCNVFFLPAKSAITPELVPPSQLLVANAFLSGAGIAATAIGALWGGWIVDHWGWRTALVINAVTYLVSVVSLALIRYVGHAHHPVVPGVTVGNYLHEVGEGWRLVRRNAQISLALLTLGAVWIGGGFIHVAGNQHIQRAASQPGMERLGVLLFILGVGSGLSTWWVNGPGRRLPRPVLLGAGLLLAGLGLVTFAVSTRFAVFAVAAFLIGVAAAPVFVLSETLLQLGTELRQRGRVFSARDFLMRLLLLLGTSVAAWAVPLFGAPATILICAVLTAGAGALALAWGRSVPELMAVPSPTSAGSPPSPREG